MALTVKYKNGVSTATPWRIEYEAFNHPTRNGFYRRQAEIEFRAA